MDNATKITSILEIPFEKSVQIGNQSHKKKKK